MSDWLYHLRSSKDLHTKMKKIIPENNLAKRFFNGKFEEQVWGCLFPQNYWHIPDKNYIWANFK